MRSILYFVAVACNTNKGGPVAVDEVEEHCIEHASPLLPWTEDTGGITGDWDTDTDLDGWSLDQGDCDDNDAAVNPGYTEVGGNGLDEDCDGSDAAPTLRLDDATWRWQGKANNTAGSRVVFAGDTNGDGVQEALIGVPDEGAALDYDGYNDRVYLVNLSGDGKGREVAVVDPDSPSGQAGRDGLAGGVDLNQDGYDDFVVARPNADGAEWPGLQFSGEFLLFFGPASGTLTENMADVRIGASLEGFGLGYRLAMGMDQVTDGTALIVASADGGGPDGLAMTWRIPLSANESTDSADTTFIESSDRTNTSSSVLAAFDADGDGTNDTAISSPESSHAGLGYAGRIYVALGPHLGNVSLDDDTHILSGDIETAYAGSAIAAAGDTNSDGYEDLLIGGAANPETDTRGGKAWLVQGPITTSASLADAAGSVVAERGYEWLGYEVAGLGDANGDDNLDIAISAPRDFYYGAGYPGKVYVFSTPLEGAYSGADADLVVQGVGINDWAGAGLDGGRDIDGDCLGDLLVGAPYRDDVGKDAGVVYLMTGLEW